MNPLVGYCTCDRNDAAAEERIQFSCALMLSGLEMS